MAKVNCVSFLFLIFFGCALSIPMGMPSYYHRHQYPAVYNNIRVVPMQDPSRFQRSSYELSYMDTGNEALSDNDKLFLQYLRNYNAKRNEARYTQQSTLDNKLNAISQQLSVLQKDTDTMKEMLNSVGFVSLMDLATDLKMAEDVEEQTRNNAELKTNIDQMLEEKSEKSPANPLESYLTSLFMIAKAKIDEENSETSDSEITDDFSIDQNEITSNEISHNDSNEDNKHTTFSTKKVETSDSIEEENEDIEYTKPTITADSNILNQDDSTHDQMGRLYMDGLLEY